jgi:hypothetical protein
VMSIEAVCNMPCVLNLCFASKYVLCNSMEGEDSCVGGWYGKVSVALCCVLFCSTFLRFFIRYFIAFD